RSRRLEPALEPLSHCTHVPQAPPGHGPPAPYFDGVTVQPIDRGEPELVRDVVTDEHRRAAAERLLPHEFQDRNTLIPAGRLQLDHPLSGLHRISSPPPGPPGPGEQRANQAVRVAPQPGRPAIVHRQGQALVLQQEPGMRRRGSGERQARAVELGRRARVVRDRTGGVATLGTVLAGGGKARPGKQDIDVGDCATADQRHGAAGRSMEPLDDPAEIAVEAGGARRPWSVGNGARWTDPPTSARWIQSATKGAAGARRRAEVTSASCSVSSATASVARSGAQNRGRLRRIYQRDRSSPTKSMIARTPAVTS